LERGLHKLARMKMSVLKGMTIRGVYGQSWKRFFTDLYHEINDDHLATGAAALAHYLMLAIFPGMIFLLGLLPYLPIAHLQDQIMELLGQLLPGETAKLFTSTVSQIVGNKKESLLSLGAVLTLWAASSGMSSIMDELNVSYDVKESRSFLKTKSIALALTLGFGALVISSFLLIVLGENIKTWVAVHWDWSTPLLFLFDLLRWIIVVMAITLAFASTYYFGPDVKQEFVLMTPGSLLATLFFILASIGFKAYVDHFGSYNATYGSLGAVIVLMIWLNILGAVVLLGSQLNSLIENYNREGQPKDKKVELSTPKDQPQPFSDSQRHLRSKSG